MARAAKSSAASGGLTGVEGLVSPGSEESCLWLGSLASYLNELEARDRIANMDISGGAISAFFDDDDDDKEEDPVFKSMTYMGQSVGSVGIIHVNGRLTNENSPMNRYFGEVSYDEIRAALGIAAEASAIENILMVYDSPGGSVTGVDETAELIKGIDAEHKPVHAHTGAMMLSGAYWLGSQARRVTSAKLAEVGSIGVVAVHKDMTERLKQMGVKATVLRSGKRKALGNPYEALTPETTKILQERIDGVHERFLTVVAEGRGLDLEYLRESAGDGRQLFGTEAVNLGLVNEIMGIDEVVADLVEASTTGAPGVPSPGGPSIEGIQLMAGKKVVLSKAAQAKIASGVPMAEAMKGEETAPAAVAAAAAAAPKVDAAAGTGTGEAEGKKDPAVAAPAAAAATAPAAEDATGALVAKLADALTSSAQHKAALDTATKALGAQEGLVTALSSACRSALTRLDVALGAAERDNTHLSGSALVEAYAKSEGNLMARYPVGGSVKVDVEEETDPLAAVSADPLQRASRKVTSLR